MQILVKNGIIITLGENNQILHNHALLIKEGKIEKFISPEEMSSLNTDQIDKIIDAQNKIVMPGFINTHMHYYSSMACGLYKVDPAYNFTEVLEKLWWKLDKQLSLEDCYYSALTANIAAIKHGTTTIIDHHASPYAIQGSLDKIAQAVKQTGLRASLCYEVSDRDGEDICQLGIQENLNFIDKCNQQDDPQLRALFGLHASFTLSNKTLEIVTKQAAELNCGFHIHCAEDISDQIETIKICDKRVVDRLFQADLLGDKTILAHAIHLNEHELNLIAETKTNVVINPQSNMNNAVGVTDLLTMHQLGIQVGLGTDAMTTNMLEELRSALWITKLHNKNPSVGFMEVTHALLNGNRNIANIYWPNLGLGELKQGGVADVIIMDYIPSTPFTLDSFLGHLIFGISQSSVETTIAAGQILMENRQLTQLDEVTIMHESQKLAEKLWSKF